MNCANHPDRERVAFCQDCGKPLCQECTRTVGSAVYCEESLAARLSGGAVPPASATGAYTQSATGSSYAYTGSDYSVPGPIPPPPPPGTPNPGLAALLGFIPGVGAMYNGQYAKGVVHLIVFAILVSLADEHGIFALFVAGWMFYQVIEAHHTARARRDGTPLPNPFGLNDLSERLGFGKAWPGNRSYPSPAAYPDTASTSGPDVTTPPYTAPEPLSGTYVPPSSTGYPPPANPSWGAPWESYAVPPVPPYPGEAYPIDPSFTTAKSRFPSGAIWLIGLGCLFLIGNAGILHGFPIHRLIPFLLIGLGVWLFVHKMTDTGSSLANDGTAAYQQRLYSALRGSVWVTLVGVLFLLDTFDILSWSHSWPLFIILAGLMAIFRRVSYTPRIPIYPYPVPPPSPIPQATAHVPSSHSDREGS